MASAALPSRTPTYLLVCSARGWWRDKEKERERETETERQRDRETERQRGRDRRVETDRGRERARARVREKERAREGEGEGDRGRQRAIQGDRDKLTESRRSVNTSVYLFVRVAWFTMDCSVNEHCTRVLHGGITGCIPARTVCRAGVCRSPCRGPRLWRTRPGPASGPPSAPSLHPSLGPSLVPSLDQPRAPARHGRPT